MRKVGYIFIVVLVIGLIITVTGAQDCGSVPPNISEDSAATLIIQDDTVPSSQQGTVGAMYHCINRVDERWPMLVIGGLLIVGTIVWLIRDAASRREAYDDR